MRDDLSPVWLIWRLRSRDCIAWQPGPGPAVPVTLGTESTTGSRYTSHPPTSLPANTYLDLVRNNIWYCQLSLSAPSHCVSDCQISVSDGLRSQVWLWDCWPLVTSPSLTVKSLQAWISVSPLACSGLRKVWPNPATLSSTRRQDRDLIFGGSSHLNQYQR